MMGRHSQLWRAARAKGDKGGIEMSDLGVCPTGEHVEHPHCGYSGCVDLRPWAKARRYRYQLEESYKAENNMHVRGDGRWLLVGSWKSFVSVGSSTPRAGIKS